MDAFDSLFLEGDDDEDVSSEVVTFAATSPSSDDYIDMASLSRDNMKAEPADAHMQKYCLRLCELNL